MTLDIHLDETHRQIKRSGKFVQGRALNLDAVARCLRVNDLALTTITGRDLQQAAPAARRQGDRARVYINQTEAVMTKEKKVPRIRLKGDYLGEGLRQRARVHADVRSDVDHKSITPRKSFGQPRYRL
jgi:hypothetical protein